MFTFSYCNSNSCLCCLFWIQLLNNLPFAWWSLQIPSEMFVRIRRRVQAERGKAVRQFRGPDQVLKTQNLLGSEVVYCETGSLSDFKRSEIRWEEATMYL